MIVQLGSQALDDLAAYLAYLELTRGEAAALRARERVFRELVHLAGLPMTARRVFIEGSEVPVFRWVVRPFVVYYDRTDAALVVQRFYPAARPSIER
jgi:plasmid stabilization system protein ParE